MKSLLKVACLAVSPLVVSLALVGCGGPDNEKSASTNTDGTPTKDVTSGEVKSMSPEEYNKSMSTGGPMKGETYKGYPKKK